MRDFSIFAQIFKTDEQHESQRTGADKESITR